MAEMDSATGSLDSARELDARDCIKVLEATPEDQAIMFVGIHGIGKSEFIKDYFANYSKHKEGEKDYAVIMLFLGQMADAGDLIGLPDRSTVTFQYGDQKVEQKITEFCPPKWWPRSDEARLVIFLDDIPEQAMVRAGIVAAVKQQLDVGVVSLKNGVVGVFAV